MLDTWERASTDEVIERVEREGGDARDKVRRAVRARRLSSDRLLRIDLAIRDWARRDEAVAERLRRVDNRRMEYLRSLFGALLPPTRTTSRRAACSPSRCAIGNHFIAADHGARSRRDVLDLAMRHLAAPAP